MGWEWEKSRSTLTNHVRSGHSPKARKTKGIMWHLPITGENTRPQWRKKEVIKNWILSVIIYYRRLDLILRLLHLSFSGSLTQQFPYITNRSWGHLQISNFLIIRTQYFCLKYQFVLKIYLLNDWNQLFRGVYWFLNCYISVFGGLFTLFK